jgi:hypothetical protein
MTGSTAPSGSDAPTPSRRGGGPPLVIAGLAIGSLVLGALLIIISALGLGVGAGATPTTVPTGEAAQLTHALVVKALEDASFQVQDPPNDYRPGESPELYSVPRGLVQVIVPSEPEGEHVVIYQLPSANEADRVGREFAAYLASGTGAIQYPRDSRFVLQRVGQTLVFFPWSPQVSPDPRVAELAAVLESVGTAVEP